ncbi:uncharacterized protein LOC116987783 [Amblyraja radiata]|uniref:uncharacterized protein LOC116987783 n=1 Tax=Amblyraja radiata TaxID=386614 RepID=UPI001403A9B7|nr:uncharacterized protein LOC116987783 [Amblyraja radiata]
MAAQIFLCLSFLFFPTITAGQSVSQSPRTIYAERGESVSMTCEITVTQGKIVGTNLLRNPLNPMDLCFVRVESVFIAETHRLRLECIGTQDAKRINITLRNLQKNDTDIYYCSSGIENGRLDNFKSKGTMLIVTDKTTQPCDDNCTEEEKCKVAVYKDPLMIAMIILAVASFLCALVLLLRHGKNRYQEAQTQRKRVPNSVHEDMNLV